jgi:hypothetical protein
MAPGSREPSSSDEVVCSASGWGDVPVALWEVVVGVDHQLAGKRLGRQVPDRPQRDRHGHDLAEASRLRDCPRPHGPLDGGDQIAQGGWAAGVAEHHLVARCREPHGQGMPDVAHTDDPDPHATLQLAALHHGTQVAGWTASCRLASGKGTPAMPESVDLIVPGLETIMEGFLAALEQLR